MSNEKKGTDYVEIRIRPYAAAALDRLCARLGVDRSVAVQAAILTAAEKVEVIEVQGKRRKRSGRGAGVEGVGSVLKRVEGGGG